MNRTIAFSFLAVLVAACGGEAPNPNTPVSSSTTENPGGQPKPGSPGCTHVVGTQCFTDAASACKAAGCEKDNCLELETMPVKVSCKK